MAIRRLDHINFITNDMPATIDFYTNIIGLVHGDKLPGAAEGMEYIYLPLQNIAVLHIGDAQIIRNSAKFRQVAKIENNLLNTGVIDHFCLQFDFDDYEIMLSRLNDNKIACEKYEHSTGQLNQIWIFDPNNIRVELNFCK